MTFVRVIVRGPISGLASAAAGKISHQVGVHRCSRRSFGNTAAEALPSSPFPTTPCVPCERANAAKPESKRFFECRKHSVRRAVVIYPHRALLRALSQQDYGEWKHSGMDEHTLSAHDQQMDASLR